MTYYIYHIPGKKIGVTRDLKYRVEEQQGYGPGEYNIMMKSDNIDLYLNKNYIYKNNMDTELTMNLIINLNLIIQI